MADLPRLNGVIRALEAGPARAHLLRARRSQFRDRDERRRNTTAVVFEMEHNPWDGRALRDCLQYMLNRAQIAKAGLGARRP